jgi:transglutaminase-like putative cysteine protease
MNGGDSRMRYHITHETLYRYGNDVVHSHQLLHLVPRPAPYQQCLEHSLRIDPAGYHRSDETDAFGNPITRIELMQPHRELAVTTEMEVLVHPRPVAPASSSLPWERTCNALRYHGLWPARENLEACRFRHESAYVRIKRAFNDYAEDCFPSSEPILACAEALMSKLHGDMRYAPGETAISTPLTEILESRRGVCQDFAHLMIACLRSRGLAARYVSGYVSSASRDAASRPTAIVGAGASHAWVAVYAPPLGWIELDPTNDTRVGTEHVAVAWGRDFGDVSPLRGIILGGGSHELSVSVSVEPLD